MQKELFKTYSGNKETKRETDGADLPDWYEVTDKGGLRFLPSVLAEYMAKEEKIFYSAE
jgi:putative DNA primase/helicase